MHCAKVCNSRPSSAAVVASVASVLNFCITVHCTVYSTNVLRSLIWRLIHWTRSKLCYKTLATAISRLQNCVTIDVHAGHLCRFLQSNGVERVAGGTFSQFDISF